jgi:hypothetical protein
MWPMTVPGGQECFHTTGEFHDPNRLEDADKKQNLAFIRWII